MPEPPIRTWKNIAEVFGVSESKMRSYKDELVACGAIWFTRQGRPPSKVVCAWPSVLKAWMAVKSAKGEFF